VKKLNREDKPATVHAAAKRRFERREFFYQTQKSFDDFSTNGQSEGTFSLKLS